MPFLKKLLKVCSRKMRKKTTRKETMGPKKEEPKRGLAALQLA